MSNSKRSNTRSGIAAEKRGYYHYIEYILTLSNTETCFVKRFLDEFTRSSRVPLHSAPSWHSTSDWPGIPPHLELSPPNSTFSDASPHTPPPARPLPPRNPSRLSGKPSIRNNVRRTPPRSGPPDALSRLHLSRNHLFPALDTHMSPLRSTTDFDANHRDITGCV